MYKLIGADGKEYGPITAAQLQQWIAEGRVNAQTRIQMEGAAEWRPLTDFPDFAAALPSAPPTLPSGPATGMATGSSSAAEQLVTGPAIALMIVGGLECLVALANLFSAALISPARQAQGPWRQMPPWANAMSSGPLLVVAAVLGILLGGLILFGAIKMKKLQSYGLAMTASIVAMLPCSLCCVIGLPLGIWSLVVLSKPEVKSAFH
jgi:hypothetical protein